MLVPDPDTRTSLRRLTEVADFVRVLAWIEKTADASVADLVTATDPVRLHQLQGAARELREFLQAARSANPSLPAYLGR